MYYKRTQNNPAESCHEGLQSCGIRTLKTNSSSKKFANISVSDAKFDPKDHCDEYFISKANLMKCLEPLETRCEPASESLISDASNDSSDENMIKSFYKIITRGKMGYLSLVMLILFTFFNFALEYVDAQLHRIDSSLLFYDSLSMEVISPPFHYKKFPNAERQHMGLGTAAISSVTDALSPILPFTGGVDLRREEHWDTTRGWFNTVSSIISQTRDVFGSETIEYFSTIPRGGDHVLSMENKKEKKADKKDRQSRIMTLSISKPFVDIDSITKMTLIDLTNTFRYAIESGTSTYSSEKFFESINPIARNIIKSLEKAVETSRGLDVAAAEKPILKNKATVVQGDIDALKFCAVMRLFAEWRVVRQVPDGYKGYAVGMTLGQRDIVQNIAKIENAVHDWIEYHQQQDNIQSDEEAWCDSRDNAEQSRKRLCRTFRSPTLRQLLEFEVSMKTHGDNRLPRLKDKTAGMGLLWVRRQLHYQTALFSNVLEVSISFKDTNSAVSAAYNEVYNKFHGWAVQKIFNYSFQAAPEPEVIFKFMNPNRLDEVMKTAQNMKISGIDNISKERIKKEIQSELKETFHEQENILQKTGKHIAGKLGRLVTFPSWKKETEIEVEMDVEGKVDIEKFVTQEMKRDAHHHISEYLRILKPLLKDLSALFEEMNMDDPTKV
eukprot:CAMPEP_0194137252 /NCGR_PEP_ID=MMETSP0152-20130528/7171_1 /TAXON_ID=1049557 /ORGANISM="Thalassiothrix antarctica, Strain L6-D1" /LENGTH=666 /DNA_ID=CAMNT_0038834209 /DNA_START=144 /DNA_END=2144 /DNA_ORIENTATION=+